MHEEIIKDFSLRDQVKRNAVSIASNIAEDDERDTYKESVRFFYIAKGSLAELRTQMQIASGIANLSKSIYDRIDSECIKLDKIIGKLIKTLQEMRIINIGSIIHIPYRPLPIAWRVL